MSQLKNQFSFINSRSREKTQHQNRFIFFKNEFMKEISAKNHFFSSN